MHTHRTANDGEDGTLKIEKEREGESGTDRQADGQRERKIRSIPSEFLR